MRTNCHASHLVSLAGSEHQALKLPQEKLSVVHRIVLREEYFVAGMMPWLEPLPAQACQYFCVSAETKGILRDSPPKHAHKKSPPYKVGCWRRSREHGFGEREMHTVIAPGMQNHLLLGPTWTVTSGCVKEEGRCLCSVLHASNKTACWKVSRKVSSRDSLHVLRSCRLLFKGQRIEIPSGARVLQIRHQRGNSFFFLGFSVRRLEGKKKNERISSGG